jgi:hypothetical protein
MMKYSALALLFVCGVAQAGGAQIGLELESEKDNRSGLTNHAVTLSPGWEFSEESPISRVELLLEHNEDTKANSDGVTAHENKFFVRVRHDGELSDRLDYYVRGGIGRSNNNEHNFNYAYVEPGMEYKLSEHWEWTVSYREINSIDGTSGQHVGEIHFGPSFDMDKNNEFELRYVRGHGDKSLTTWEFEYAHKY